MDIVCCVLEHFQFCSNNVHTWRDGFALLEWNYDLQISYVEFLNIFSFVLTMCIRGATASRRWNGIFAGY